MWCPDMHRLFMQKRLTAEQRASLRDLLALEGPDFLTKEQPTLREALVVASSSCLLPAEVGWARIQLKVQNLAACGPRDMYERLSSAVNAACTSSAHDINLLAHLCCSGKPIDDHTLTILEANSYMGNSSVSADVLLILRPQNGTHGRSFQMAAVMRLLSALGQPNGQALRDALSPYLVNLVSTSIRVMQAMLSIQLEDSNSVRQLHAFGMGVQAAQWLHQFLDDTLRTLISRWPSTENFSAMDTLQSYFQTLAQSGGLHTLRQQLNDYYTECLIEPDTIHPDTKSLIEGLIQLWRQEPGPDRQCISLCNSRGSRHGYPHTLRMLEAASDSP